MINLINDHLCIYLLPLHRILVCVKCFEKEHLKALYKIKFIIILLVCSTIGLNKKAVGINENANLCQWFTLVHKSALRSWTQNRPNVASVGSRQNWPNGAETQLSVGSRQVSGWQASQFSLYRLKKKVNLCTIHGNVRPVLHMRNISVSTSLTCLCCCVLWIMCMYML